MIIEKDRKEKDQAIESLALDAPLDEKTAVKVAGSC